MSTPRMKVTISSIHRDSVELIAWNDDDAFKLYLYITLDDAEKLGEMLNDVREVARKVVE